MRKILSYAPLAAGSLARLRRNRVAFGLTRPVARQ